jgi:hypothetical protein
LLIEIQTRNFAAIKSKLIRLVRSHQVRLVHPIVQEKWIVRPSGDGVVRRKSPARGRVEHLFRELVSIPQLLSSPNFSLDILMISEEEVRRYEEKRQWRRRGWGIEGRRLLKVLDQRLFERSADWLRFLPVGVESFTTNDLATAMAARGELAQKMAYCLREGRVIELIGRRGRSSRPCSDLPNRGTGCVRFACFATRPACPPVPRSGVPSNRRSGARSISS